MLQPISNLALNSHATMRIIMDDRTGAKCYYDMRGICACDAKIENLKGKDKFY